MGIVGCVIGLASCGQTQKGEMQAGGYEIMKVEKANKVVETGYSASIRGRQDINIMPQVSGTIHKLCVTEGEKVKKIRYFLLLTRFLIKLLLIQL